MDDSQRLSSSPQEHKYGEVQDLQGSELLKICSLFRQTYESYCMGSNGLTRTLGGTNGYLGGSVKYPTCTRFLSDIRGAKFEGGEEEEEGGGGGPQ